MHRQQIVKISLGPWHSLPPWLWVVIITIAIVAPYWQVRNFDFVWDDVHFVRDNYGIRSLQPINRFFTDQTTLTTSRPEYRQEIYRPLRTIAYALLYNYFGVQPRPYHLFNLFAYLTCTLLFFFTCRRFTLSPPAAAIATLLFAWHPLHTEAVAWVSSLSELLAANFFLLALLFFYDLPKWPRPAWSKAVAILLFYPAALFSKEISITLPALLGVIWYAERPRLSFHERRQQAAWIGVGFIIAVSYFLWRAHILGHVAQSAFNADYSKLTLLNVPLTLALNIKLLLLPYPQNSFHPYYFSPITAPLFWYGVGAAVLYLAIAWLIRRSAPRLAIAMLLLLITLTPILNLLAINIHIAERFLFLPSLIFCAAVGLAWQEWQERSRSPLLPTVATLGFLLAMLLLTWVRLPIWENENRLFADPLQQENPIPEAFENFGVLKQHQQQWQEAEWAFSRQAALTPKDARPYNNLSALALAQKKWDIALKHAQQAVALNPSNARGYDNLAIATANLGNQQAAFAYFEKAASLAPNDVSILTNLGIAYLNQRNLPAAISTFERCKMLQPLNVDVQQWLSRSYALRDAGIIRK